MEAFNTSLSKETHSKAATFTLGNLCTPQILDILETADGMPETQVSPAAIQISILWVSTDISRTDVQQKFKVVDQERPEWEREYWAEQGIYLISEQDIEQARNILNVASINPEDKQLFDHIGTLP